MIVLGGDLETDGKGSDRWVVQWCIHDGVNEHHGQSLDEFFSELLLYIEEDDVTIYFHNLRYDLSYLKNKLGEFIDYNNLEMNAIIRDNSPILLKITPKDVSSSLHELRICDSAKKLPGKLAELGKLIGIPKLEGFDVKNEGWSNNIDFNDIKNWNYVIRDAEIVAVAMNELHNDGFTKSTASGDAWKMAQESITSIDSKTGKEKPGFLKWKYNYPIIDIKLDEIFRKGYYGGLNISLKKGHITGDITVVDVVSMYPSIMYYNELPYGEPVEVFKKPEADLFIVSGEYKIKLKPEAKGYSWFMFKNKLDRLLEGLAIGDPVLDTKEFHKMTLTSVDYELLHCWYDVEIKPNTKERYWKFKSGTGMFCNYIDKFIKIKKENPKGSLKREHAKLMLNSLYGRFGLNPNVEDNELVFNTTTSNYEWESTDTINVDNKAYLPLAMFVTAYARVKLLNYVAAVGVDRIIHGDTDGLIHTGKPDAKGINYGSNLGDWEIKTSPVEMYEGGFKRYVLIYSKTINEINSMTVAAAGVSRDLKNEEIPTGMWVEVVDDPSLICSDKELGETNYKVKSKWLRDLYIKNGLDADNVNTMKLIGIPGNGGTVLVERKHKLKDSIMRRRR